MILRSWARSLVAGMVFTLLPAGAAAAEREHFQLKLSPSYDQGDFGTGETTHTMFFPVTFRYLGERFDVSATGSLVYLNAPGEIALIDFTPERTEQARRGRESNFGLGDIILKARYFALDDPGPESWLPSLAPFVKLKLPTADEDRGLGTGEPDGGLGVEFDKTFGRLIVFGDASFTIMGDPPGQDFRNRTAASLGVGYRVTDSTTVSAVLDWRRALVARNDDPLELAGVVIIRLSPTMTLSPNVFVGLTEGSPDFGVGVELSLKFGRW